MLQRTKEIQGLVLYLYSWKESQNMMVLLTVVYKCKCNLCNWKRPKYITFLIVQQDCISFNDLFMLNSHITCLHVISFNGSKATFYFLDNYILMQFFWSEELLIVSFIIKICEVALWYHMLSYYMKINHLQSNLESVKQKSMIGINSIVLDFTSK